MPNYTLTEVREHTYKARDSWWTVFLVDPLAGRLVVWTANRTAITPNQLTLGAALLGLTSAVCFALGSWPWLLAGALLFHLSFVLDCMDGKIARLKDTGTVFGMWVDFVLDRVRFFGCMGALLVGQWLVTGSVVYLLLAPVVIFVDLMRYLNGSQVAKTRRVMRERLRVATAEQSEQTAPVSEEATSPDNGEPTPQDPGDAASDVVLVEEQRNVEEPSRPATLVEIGRRNYRRIRAKLRHRRVRPHLFSGIEFEMFVCVVAPATAVLWVLGVPSLIVAIVVFACAALTMFELLIIYRLWVATRRFGEKMRQLSH